MRGAETGVFDQRVPVPIGMWRPFTSSGVRLNLAGPATFMLRGQRAAVLICYEQLIPWTWISAIAEHPTIILAVSNDEWNTGTTLNQYRTAVARSWSILFRLPLVAASKVKATNRLLTEGL